MEFILNIGTKPLLLLLLLSRFSHVWPCATPQTAAHQAPHSVGFSRQEHWSGLPFPSPMHESRKWKWNHSVVSDSSWPHGLQPTRLLHPWDFSRQECCSGLPVPSSTKLSIMFTVLCILSTMFCLLCLPVCLLFYMMLTTALWNQCYH